MASGTQALKAAQPHLPLANEPFIELGLSKRPIKKDEDGLFSRARCDRTRDDEFKRDVGWREGRNVLC